MRAVRYYGKEDIRLEDIDEPELRPGTVKIAPAFVGLCGSDLHLYTDGPMPPVPSADVPHPLTGETLPVVLGHEFSGTVEAVGEGVTGIAVGDAVAVEPLLVDGTCHACQTGVYNLCAQIGCLGVSGGGGGLSEHVIVEERWVHPVGDMPLDEAALIEPLAVAMHAVTHSRAAAGQTAVVGGAGPVGLLIASVLRARGLSVIISEVSQHRRSAAEAMGIAELVVDPAVQDLKTAVLAHTAGAGAELAFDVAGAAAVVHQLLDVLAPGGRLQIVAMHPTPIELNIAAELTMQDREIGSALGYANEHPAAIELVRSGKIDLAPFITSRISIDRIVEDGFARLAQPGNEEIKILVSLL